MSDFRFGDDYRLSYYPHGECDEFDTIDWSKIKSVEIDLTEFINVVRCRNCIEYRPELYKNITCERHMSYMKPDDYCSYGKRKDGD